MAYTRNQFLRILALIAVITVVAASLFGGKFAAAFQRSRSEHQSAAAERKVLYWYDAMDPQHHYDRPVKLQTAWTW